MRAFCLCFLALVFGSTGLVAEVAPSQAAAVEQVAVQEQRAALIPAISVAIVSGDGPVWSRAWGYSDLENRVAATPDSMFRIASISKPATAVAVMLLAQEGKLDLDADVRRYVPAFPEKPWPVTTRQLLGHLGGIRHYRPDYSDMNSTKHYWSVTEALEMFAYDPLEHEPGTKYLYTSFGFNLAGGAVERIARMPFDRFVAERILQPAGARTMQPDDVYRLIPHRVRGYRKRTDGGIENCALADTSNKIPGGGWIASPTDLVQFARFVMTGDALTRQSVEAMWTSQKLKSGAPTGYGMGWQVSREKGRLVVSHGGGQQGTSTYLLLVPEKRIAIAVFANLEGAGAQGIASKILEALEGAGS